MKQTLYYVGRLLQLFGMFELLVDIITAGPLGPSPKLFAVGIAVFVAGLALVRLTR
jgi:hypothetical protein